jgi:hypothetical protein
MTLGKIKERRSFRSLLLERRWASRRHNKPPVSWKGLPECAEDDDRPSGLLDLDLQGKIMYEQGLSGKNKSHPWESVWGGCAGQFNPVQFCTLRGPGCLTALCLAD